MKDNIYLKVKGSERIRRVRCLGKLPRRGSSNSNWDDKVKKLESLVGDLVAVLQLCFAGDPQVNVNLQVVAQEVGIFQLKFCNQKFNSTMIQYFRKNIFMFGIYTCSDCSN